MLLNRSAWHNRLIPMDKNKLAKLVKIKQTELDMTQVQFAEYFSARYLPDSRVVSYGWVQAVTNPNPKKDSIPDWENMVGIAKMWNVTLDELWQYLENPEIESIYDVSKFYKDMTDKQIDTGMAWKLIEPMTSEDKASLVQLLINDMTEKLSRLKRLEETLSRLKGDL